MTMFANNPTPKLAQSDGDAIVRGPWTVRWTCTRRADDAMGGSALEHVCFAVSVQPLDRQHAMIEAWLETGASGSQVRTVLHPTSRRCSMVCSNDSLHLDVYAGDGGDRVLAMTLSADAAHVIYVRTSLLHESGLTAGSYDPPTLLRTARDRVAHSA